MMINNNQSLENVHQSYQCPGRIQGTELISQLSQLTTSQMQQNILDNSTLIQEMKNQETSNSYNSQIETEFGNSQQCQQLNIKQSNESNQVQDIKQKNCFDKDQKYLQISVYKQHQLSNKKVYVLQDDKIIGSNQPPKNEISIIRRKKQQQNGDTNLDLSDSQTNQQDKIPCKIYTQFGFRHSNQITPILMSFLQLTKQHNNFQSLPIQTIKLIYSFIKEQPKFYIQDCGTNLKTLVRIFKDKPILMKLNSNYLIGADFYFHVVSLNSVLVEQKKKKQQCIEDENDYFFQTLIRENEHSKLRIHGLTSVETEKYQKSLQQYKEQKKKGRKRYFLENCKRPFLKIQFDTPQNKEQAIFISEYGKVQTFKIGRSQDCDIIVHLNTVSRKQTQIIFNKDKWEIIDGEGNKGSANGTWQALQPYNQIFYENEIQKESDPYQIEDQMEIKISENVFKFDLVNFGVFKRRKLTSTTYQELINH